MRSSTGPLPRTRYSPVAWLPGGEQFYYVSRLAPELVPADESQYHHRVYLHRVGTPAEDDVMVFGDGHGQDRATSASRSAATAVG